MQSDSWSEKHYPGLPQYQHDANDAWFKSMLAMLTPDGVLVVPTLGKRFDKQGKEIRDGS